VKPVVSTRCGGPEEYVRDGETGRLVGFDPKDMAAALREVVEDPASNRRLRANARHMAGERYGRESFRAAFWAFFTEVFAAHGNRREARTPAAAPLPRDVLAPPGGLPENA